MLNVLFAILFLSIAALCVTMRKTYDLVPIHELKRQASQGNALAKDLYKAVGYGLSLRVLLWVILAISAASGFVSLVVSTPIWVSILIIAVYVWLIFSWLPSTRVTGLATRITQQLTPALVWLLSHFDPWLRRLAIPLIKRYRPTHSGLYELQDLLNLLELQSRQADSRITAEEIELIRQVLAFGDKKVRDVLRPRKDVKSVAINDTIGPVLLDELHASGQSCFPVKKSPRSKEIIASLHLNDVGIHSTGTVADYATQGVTYIHEADSLADALHVFYQTKQQLFVVVDGFAEYVGVLTLEDILFVLVGEPRANESLGQYNDSSAVAARHDSAESEDKTDETVVE